MPTIDRAPDRPPKPIQLAAELARRGETQAAVAIRGLLEDQARSVELLIKCYRAGHREGWQDGATNNEVFDEVNNFLSDKLGSDWGDRYIGDK